MTTTSSILLLGLLVWALASLAWLAILLAVAIIQAGVSYSEAVLAR